MKKLIALLMTLVMLIGACVAFAEAGAVDHHAALDAMLAAAGVELQPGDLSRPFQKALKNTVSRLVLTHTRMTEEQLTEWEEVKAVAMEEIEALETKDEDQSAKILNDAINGMESITPFSKSMLKRTIFEGLYLKNEITQKERRAIRAIYNALEEALHGADEARTEEVLAGVKEGMKELVGLHNVRDDMMFILKFLQDANKSFALEDDVLERSLLTAAGQVMENLAEEIEAALAALPAADEEQVQEFSTFVERQVAALERMTAGELAATETHVSDLVNAVLQEDQEALKENVRYLMSHISAQLDRSNYEVLMGMEDEELRALAIELLRVAHAWENGHLDGSLIEELNALELNWSDLSEEDMVMLKDAVAKKIGSVGVSEEAMERAVDGMVNNVIVFSGFSEEEKAVANSFLNLLYRNLEKKQLDTAQLAELEHEMETLLYDLTGDSEKYQVTPEDLAAVLGNLDLEKVEGLSNNAKLLLVIRFLEHFEVYSMLPKEVTAKLPEIDKALYEAIQGVEVNGQETTMEQLQALEAAVVEVTSQLNLPTEVMAKEVAKTVFNCLYMSSLSAEEQEIVEAAMEAISHTLAEGYRDDVRVLRNYLHQVQHRIEESLLTSQDAQV